MRQRLMSRAPWNKLRAGGSKWPGIFTHLDRRLHSHDPRLLLQLPRHAHDRRRQQDLEDLHQLDLN